MRTRKTARTPLRTPRLKKRGGGRRKDGVDRDRRQEGKERVGNNDPTNQGKPREEQAQKRNQEMHSTHGNGMRCRKVKGLSQEVVMATRIANIIAEKMQGIRI